MKAPRVHDLLRIRPDAALCTAEPEDWVRRSLAAAPWVVVRRAASIAGRIPVGVRGDSREQRRAASISAADVIEMFSPEELRSRAPARRHPAFDALAELAPHLDRTRCAWGPVGAAGFELASGVRALRDASDLDIVLRVEAPDDLDRLNLLSAAARGCAVRVDILVETPGGAAALDELLREAGQVVVRSMGGARLVARDALRQTLWPAPIV